MASTEQGRTVQIVMQHLLAICKDAGHSSDLFHKIMERYIEEHFPVLKDDEEPTHMALSETGNSFGRGTGRSGQT